jgi:hypothetical protein
MIDEELVVDGDETWYKGSHTCHYTWVVGIVLMSFAIGMMIGNC